MKKNMKDSIIITACPFCGHSHVVEVNEADYLAWKGGALVQDVFPYLSADEREMLVSGICPDCWDDMFGDSDEDDEDFSDYEDDVDECGFNPYMGCYDFDC